MQVRVAGFFEAILQKTDPTALIGKDVRVREILQVRVAGWSV